MNKKTQIREYCNMDEKLMIVRDESPGFVVYSNLES